MGNYYHVLMEFVPRCALICRLSKINQWVTIVFSRLLYVKRLFETGALPAATRLMLPRQVRFIVVLISPDQVSISVNIRTYGLLLIGWHHRCCNHGKLSNSQRPTACGQYVIE